MARAVVVVGVLLGVLCHQNSALPLEIRNSPLGQSANLEANIEYLRTFGYLPKATDPEDSLLKVVDIEAAVLRLQKYGNVPQTGEFDAATVALMETPRCGVPDPAGVSEETNQALGGALQKRYAHTGGVWEKTTLTYRILNAAGSGHISGIESNDALRAAFKLWSDVTPLVFEERTSGYADIYLKFGPYYHGDNYPFDGPGYTLAHAYPPMSGFGDLDGDVHFDDSEPYTLGTTEGINLFQVAAHEIGHALGLAHSDVAGALMQPFYQGYVKDYVLPYDDTLGIQLLYGSPPSTGGGGGGGGAGGEEPRATTPKPGVATKPPTTGCNALEFNAIGYIRSELFAFKNDRYWRIRAPKQLLTSIEGDESKYFWYELPPNIDAAYERYHDQRILFFKGDQYWEYNGLNALTGFPKFIKELDAQLPINIDAILTYDEYQKTYFFKGDQVWRYDEPTSMMDADWPYLIKDVFPGVPNNINAAFRYKDGAVIFVKGSQYYMFSDVLKNVQPGYPKSFGVDFLGCSPDALGDNENSNGDGKNGATSTTPTLLGVVLGSLIMVLNQLW